MNKLRLILDAVPNGMMVIDERGVIVFVNSHIEQMFGYSREELIGRDVEALNSRAVPRSASGTPPALCK